jgi:uncharacterized membrane protein
MQLTCTNYSSRNVLSFVALIIRTLVRLLLAALFLFAGTLHLRHPELFLPVMPPWIPFHLACIEISGVFELLGGVGLLIPARPIQVLTGWGLALLLLAVFPANIYMALAHLKIHGFPSEPWMGWARLPVQPLLIVAVLWVTRVWHGNGNNQKPPIPNTPIK